MLRARGPVRGRRVFFTGRPPRPGACPASLVVEGDYTDGADGQPQSERPSLSAREDVGRKYSWGRHWGKLCFLLLEKLP